MTIPSTPSPKNKLTKAQQQWLARVDAIIEARLEDSTFVIAHIAMELFTSERQFYRKLKRITQKTPNQYVQEARIQRARRMLESGYRSDLSTLARAVGYKRADYFSNIYEQYYGLRPIEEINGNKKR